MKDEKKYSFGQASIDLIKNPKKAFPYFIEDASFDKRMLFIAIYGICTAIYKIDFQDYTTTVALLIKILFKALLGFIGGWIVLYLYALLLTLVNGLFKSETEINDNLSILTFSSIPFIIGLTLIIIIKIFFIDLLFIINAIYMLSYLWMIQITIIGNKINSKMSLIKSAISVLSPFIIFIIIFVTIYLLSK